MTGPILDPQEAFRMNMEQKMAFKGATCRGSYILGTECGRCERCDAERSKIKGNWTFVAGAGTIREADSTLNLAEVQAVNSLNRKDKTEREIISDLLAAIGRARISLESARVTIGRSL